MLELKNLRKDYGSLKAVHDVNLTIQDGEFFSLLGPSGCGKSTLLRILAGIEPPTSGEIFQNQIRIDTLPANQRQFNMVFQRYALFPHLSVWENIAFGLRMKNVKEPELNSRVSEALALVKMDEFGSRRIETLSGGQQQRIALARALVNRPKILLLDEPLSALDLKLRQQMQVELRALQRRLKHSFVFVTHDQEEALTLSDRIAVMNQGRVEQVGTPQEIYEYPRTLFVAQFIGSMNFFEGEVREVRTDSVVLLGASKRPLLIKPSRDGSRPLPSVELGKRARILVRPEKIKILKSSPALDQNGIEGTLSEVLYKGAMTEFHLLLKDSLGPLVIVNQPNTAVTARKQFSIGERVFLSWSPEDGILMGKDSSLELPSSSQGVELSTRVVSDTSKFGAILG